MMVSCFEFRFHGFYFNNNNKTASSIERAKTEYGWLNHC